jgi:hypothetical protein
MAAVNGKGDAEQEQQASEALGAEGNSAAATGGASPPPEDENGNKEQEPKDGKQLKQLSEKEIKELKKNGVDIHELKGKGSSRYDLYKDRNGNVYQMLKGGRGEPQSTGINLKG